MMEENLLYDGDAVAESIIKIASGMDVENLNHLLVNLEGMEQLAQASDLVQEEEHLEAAVVSDAPTEPCVPNQSVVSESMLSTVELSEVNPLLLASPLPAVSQYKSIDLHAPSIRLEEDVKIEPPEQQEVADAATEDDNEGNMETYVLLDESLINSKNMPPELHYALLSAGIEDGEEIILQEEYEEDDGDIKEENGDFSGDGGEDGEMGEEAKPEVKFVIRNGKGFLVQKNRSNEMKNLVKSNRTAKPPPGPGTGPADLGAFVMAANGGWKCPVCPHVAPQKGTLQSHITQAHGPIRHECNLCPKSFCSYANLKKHIEYHKNPLVCKYCQKTFISDCGFQRHINLHEGTLKKYMCDVCGTVVCNLHTFEGHMNRHNNVRPFSCEKCGRSYENRDHLALHKKCSRSCDGESKELYVCHSCGKGFTYKRHYRRHTLYAHKEPSCRCNVCGRMLKSPDCLRAHLKTHKRQYVLPKPEPSAPAKPNIPGPEASQQHLLQNAEPSLLQHSTQPITQAVQGLPDALQHAFTQPISQPISQATSTIFLPNVANIIHKSLTDQNPSVAMQLQLPNF